MQYEKNQCALLSAGPFSNSDHSDVSCPVLFLYVTMESPKYSQRNDILYIQQYKCVIYDTNELIYDKDELELRF